jgi:hypothetical protein
MSCGGELPANTQVIFRDIHAEISMRSVLLWAIGIPLPIILLLWLVTGHA